MKAMRKSPPLTLAEASSRIGRGERTVRRYVEQGRLRGVANGLGVLMVEAASVEEFLKPVAVKVKVKGRAKNARV